MKRPRKDQGTDVPRSPQNRPSGFIGASPICSGGRSTGFRGFRLAARDDSGRFAMPAIDARHLGMFKFQSRELNELRDFGDGIHSEFA